MLIRINEGRRKGRGRGPPLLKSKENVSHPALLLWHQLHSKLFAKQQEIRYTAARAIDGNADLYLQYLIPQQMNSRLGKTRRL